MPAMELLCQIIGIETHKLSKEEKLILEAELLYRLCEGLKINYKCQYKEYFHLLKLTFEMEDVVLEASFLRCVINDILTTETYTIPGIAYYTQTPEDIIYEIASGCNTNPSLFLARKVIELHRVVRPELYRDILMKVVQESAIACQK